MNVDSKAVLTQLDKILASPEFSGSDLLAKFLRHVIREKLNGRPDSISQYSIAVEALGYPDDFDPQSSPMVRIHAQRLRRALITYYSDIGEQDSIRIDIPKGGYVPTFSNRTNGGATPEVRSVSEKPIPDEALLPSIAVIAFENQTLPEELSFFTYGLTSEIVVSLSRFSDLNVLGPFDRAQLAQSQVEDICRNSCVAYALHGFTRSVDSKIRVTVEMKELDTAKNLWGMTYEYDIEEVSLFTIEDEITAKVVGVIADSLGVIFRQLYSGLYHKSITFNDISLAVLRYQHAWLTHTPEAFGDALVALDNTLKRYPDHATLLALRANVCYAEVLYGLKLIDDPVREMELYAHKAVSIDPHLQIARYNFVIINAFFGRAEKCVAEARSTIQLNPNHARILSGSAVAVAEVGAYDFGMELIEKAKQLNPHYPGWYHFVDYLVHFAHKRYNDAWEHAQRIELNGLYWHPLLRAAILGKLERVAEAKPYVEELLELRPDFTDRPSEYIKPVFVIDEHIEMILDGLKSAGLHV